MIIYCFTNIIDGKVYIGKTVRPQRFLSGKYMGSSPTHCQFKRAVAKHGEHNFARSILETIQVTGDRKHDIKVLNEAERKHIAEARERLGRDMVYNHMDGGDGGNTNDYMERSWKDPEFAKHMSELQLALWQDPEHSARRIAAMKGSNSPELRAAKSQRLRKARLDPVKNAAWKLKRDEFWADPARCTQVCPHCGASGKGGIMKRWHFNRCKKLVLAG